MTRLQLDIYKGIDENLPDLSNLANSILPLLRTAVEGIGGGSTVGIAVDSEGH